MASLPLRLQLLDLLLELLVCQHVVAPLRHACVHSVAQQLAKLHGGLCLAAAQPSVRRPERGLACPAAERRAVQRVSPSESDAEFFNETTARSSVHRGFDEDGHAQLAPGLAGAHRCIRPARFVITA